MKIIIAGAGSVGKYMAKQLAAGGHEVTLIDNDPSVVSRTKDYPVTLGDACEVDTLARAGASTADVVAGVTGDDEDNLVVSLLAKQEFGVPRVVARVNNPNNEWMFNEMWGIDVSVSTPHLLTALVEEAVTVGSYVRLMSFEHGKAELAEVTLAEGSPAIGKTIGEIQLPREATIVGLIRNTLVVAPLADLALQAKDEVLVLTAIEAKGDIHTALIGNADPGAK